MIQKHFFCVFFLPAVILLLILASCCQKGLKENDMSHSLQIESETLNETRDIFVHLPEGYEDADRRYPVLYVLDGESIFTFAVGAVEFLSTSRMPEMIVVGIPNSNRERDQWVSLEPDGGYIKFVDFLESELIPYINTHYRTQSFQIFYGFCSGSSTCLWILLTRPEMFKGYIAAGTGFDQTWYDLAKEKFGKRSSLKKSLFAVTEGTTPRAEGNRMLRQLLETSAPPDLT